MSDKPPRKTSPPQPPANKKTKFSTSPKVASANRNPTTPAVPLAKVVSEVLKMIKPELLNMVNEAVAKVMSSQCSPLEVLSEDLQKSKSEAAAYVTKVSSLQKEVEDLQKRLINVQAEHDQRLEEFKASFWADKKDHDEKLDTGIQKFYRETSRDVLVNHLYMDSQEQYERRDCIIVKNLREFGPSENLSMLVIEACKAMGGNIAHFEISVAHRMGRFIPGQTRPVIVKFTRRHIKNCVMRNKYKLRHARGWETVYIEENLTVWRSHLVSKLRQQREVKKLHTNDGKIFFLKDGKNYSFNDPKDFPSMPFSDTFYKEVNISPDLKTR